MSVETKHPDITPVRAAEWRLMRDAMNGDGAVKAAGELYLPKPSGFASRPDKGEAAYLAYKSRAQFPEIVAPSIGAMVGMSHAKETRIELPESMQYLFERATPEGLTLEALHRRITRNLLWLGRFGLLPEAPLDGGDPYLACYAGDAIINWDENFFVLDESDYVRDGYKWKPVKQFRVLSVEEGRYVQRLIIDGIEQEDFAEAQARGGASLSEVPFAVASSRDITTDLYSPPLIGVANAARAIYQLSADYRWQLYMSGQETLVAINGESPEEVGAGVVHEMHGTEGITPDLKYVSPSCSGIEAHRVAIEENRMAAVMAGARLFDGKADGNESGKARKLRFASETATLMSVTLAGAGLLERSLKHIARMLGANEDQVIVEPPQDFLDTEMTPQEAQALVGMWQAGAFSYKTLYENLQRGGIASMERDDIQELGEIDRATFMDDEGELA